MCAFGYWVFLFGTQRPTYCWGIIVGKFSPLVWPMQIDMVGLGDDTLLPQFINLRLKKKVVIMHARSGNVYIDLITEEKKILYMDLQARSQLCYDYKF